MLGILKGDTTESGTLLDRMPMTKRTQSGTTHVQTMGYGWLPARLRGPLSKTGPVAPRAHERTSTSAAGPTKNSSGEPPSGGTM